MTSLPLLREAILPRLDGIAKDLKRLAELAGHPGEEFQRKGDTFALAQHHLRLVLEGVFHLGAHVLSRLEGSRAREYTEIASQLGQAGVVSAEFANDKLVEMAKMRNLLTHGYAEVDPLRLHRILHENLKDVEVYLTAVKAVVEDPGKFGLTIE